MVTVSFERVLVTGAAGQIGSELVSRLRDKYGPENVIASDIKTELPPSLKDSGPYEVVDVTSPQRIREVIQQHQIHIIYHMPAILSAVGEQNPQLAWKVNIGGTHNVLEAARELRVQRIFVPSSIAAFGPETPKENTPQATILKPKTMYGVTKVAGELLCEYYVHHYGLDIRGCRYPGIVSSETLPGGGTTDYAVAIFYEAVKNKSYQCFLERNAMLPMMYMPDCLKATIELMEADFSKLVHHCDFNIAGMSFTPEQLAVEIQKHIPGFTIEYKPDYRQKIAESWPRSIDDSAARKEWGWEPEYDLASMTEDMVNRLKRKHREGQLP